MNNNSNTPPPPNDSEGRRRFIADAVQHFYKKDPKLTEGEEVLLKAEKLTNMVHHHIKPVLAAGGGFDRDSLGALIAKLYLEGFDLFSKEELILICTTYHTGIAMGIIEASPFGSDTPDLMGGV